MTLVSLRRALFGSVAVSADNSPTDVEVRLHPSDWRAEAPLIGGTPTGAAGRSFAAGTPVAGGAHFDETVFKHLVYVPVVALRRQPVLRYLRALEHTQRVSVSELRELQVGRLRALVNGACATVPHYRRTISSPAPPIRDIGDLRNLPFVEKRELREHLDLFRAVPLPGRCVAKTTGGSTGEPVTILKTADATARELAAMWRGYRWAGIDIGARQARFWGVPFTRRERNRARLIDFVCHRRRCSAFAFDSGSMDRYGRRLQRFQPTYFYGYVSMLVAFANHYRARSARPPFRLRCIVTTSEVLTAGDRMLLEDVFEAPVFNEYGCGEVGTIAHECEHGRLHLNEENMVVEVLDGETACAPGQKGELVITELNNSAMPLIRYRTGDFGAISPHPCPCGRTLAVLDQVFGRAYDFVSTADGKQFHGEFLMYIFEETQRHQLGIAQFQVQQETLTRFCVRIVPGPDFNAGSTQRIAARMREYLGQEIEIRFDTVADIPREPSGKMRVIIGLNGAAPPSTGHAPERNGPAPFPTGQR
jgi:phenylacetate-CoA ligase